MIYEKNRQTELLIDLNAMKHNYEQIQKECPNKTILPVLKASGYGIGARTVKAFIDKMNLYKDFYNDKNLGRCPQFGHRHIAVFRERDPFEPKTAQN